MDSKQEVLTDVWSRTRALLVPPLGGRYDSAVPPGSSCSRSLRPALNPSYGFRNMSKRCKSVQQYQFITPVSEKEASKNN